MYYTEDTQLEWWLFKDGKHQFQEDETDKAKMIVLRREKQFNEMEDKTNHATKSYYSPFTSEEAVDKLKRFQSTQPYIELPTITRMSQMQDYKTEDSETFIHQEVGVIKSSIGDIEITVQQEAHHEEPKNIEIFIQKKVLINEEAKEPIIRPELRVLTPAKELIDTSQKEDRICKRKKIHSHKNLQNLIKKKTAYL
ncbi:unnamed protein product [Cercopithifilaria johnstoni]|uniref:Uncharacterized protein n=1 Tax=Cercopithifilaria johnstoni TaxID=2874296 RepID=A0A8J2Q992_9BILA|nr:unnamed protein product [Cercopithifilaria johnstoni]